MTAGIGYVVKRDFDGTYRSAHGSLSDWVEHIEHARIYGPENAETTARWLKMMNNLDCQVVAVEVREVEVQP